jgi:hypothetical protein
VSDTGFTPGPWFVSHEDSDPPRPFVCTAGDVVCLMDPNHPADDPYDAANANLIASAPELYEALEWAVRQIPAELIETKAAGLKYDGCIRILRKARGETA